MRNVVGVSWQPLLALVLVACGSSACGSSGPAGDERVPIDRYAMPSSTTAAGPRMDAEGASMQPASRVPASAPTTPDPDDGIDSTPPAPVAGSAAPSAPSSQPVSVPPPADLGNGTGIANAKRTLNGCDAPDAFDPLVARADETCWTFAAHDASSRTDSSKFQVPQDESYSQFYFDVPWPAGSLASAYGPRLDNAAVVRHGLMFSSDSPTPNGTVARNVTGTTLGENAELIAAWTPGACNTRYPDDFGGKLPDHGKIMVQWHHYNDTGSVQADGSALVICTVPAGSRPHVGGLTILGTESLDGLSGIEGVRGFNSECRNDSGKPITIVGFQPHMRAFGIRSVHLDIEQSGAGVTIFDQPFDPEHQVHYLYDGAQVLAPGRFLTTNCVYENRTGRAVGFGMSAHQETCFQIAFAYPYGALSNGVVSLIGATNTCW